MFYAADSCQVAMPGDAKVRNQQNILRIVRSGEVLTAAEIHQQTGISRQTVMRALQHFCQRGVVRSLGPGESTSQGGKKPELFQFADERKILCVNLWPDLTSFAVSSLTGALSPVTTYTTPCSKGSIDEALACVKMRACAYLTSQGLTVGGLYGVVLSVSGTVDYATKALRFNSQAPHWGGDIPMLEKLRALFGESLEYYVDNAGKAVGRSVLLDHPAYADIRLLTLFTTWGVSSCLIERGRVLNGRNSLIGEIGHMVISDTQETVCGCGKRGCLESMVSLQRMRRLMRDAGAQDADTLTFEALFALSEAGDARARQVVREMAHCFAVALHNLSLVYDPETVLFQGDFAHADAYFDECLRRELGEFRYYPKDSLFDVHYDRRDLCALASRGAAGRLIEKYFASLTEGE